MSVSSMVLIRMEATHLVCRVQPCDLNDVDALSSLSTLRFVVEQQSSCLAFPL